MSKSIAGRNASTGDLDSFKRRANKTRESLTQLFRPSIEAGDKNVFSQARVYEYQARQEGFSNYASVKAAGGSQQNDTPNPDTIALMKLAYPDFYAFTTKFGANRGIEVEIQAWEKDGLIDPTENLTAIFICGTDSSGFVLDDERTVSNVESGDMPYSFVCDYTHFEAAVQICPVPDEWSDKPFADYVKAHVKSWEKKLISDIEVKITRVLREVLKSINNYKEKFDQCVEELSFDSFDDSFLGEPYVVLRPYLHDSIPFHVIDRVGNYLVFAFSPTIFSEGSGFIADYLLSFGFVDIYSFSDAISEDIQDRFSCHTDWFVIGYESEAEPREPKIFLYDNPNYKKGRLPIPVPQMAKPGSWYGDFEMIHDKKVMDEIQQRITGLLKAPM